MNRQRGKFFVSGIAMFWRRHGFGLLAVFIALGGTAYALERNSVKSSHIVNGQVRSADLQDDSILGVDVADGAVGSSEIEDRSIGANDIGLQSLTAGEIADTGSLTTAEIAEAGLAITGDATGTLGNVQLGLNSVGSAEVAPNSLGGADIDEGSLVTAVPVDAVTTQDCDPNSSAYVTCVSVALNAPAAGAVMVNAAVLWYTDVGGGAGSCQIDIDDEVFSSLPIGETERTTDRSHQNTFAMTQVKNVNAGPHTVALACREDESDITFRQPNISAVWFVG